MGQRANFQNSYLWRYLAIGLGCLAFSGWFAYDGFVAYPKKLEYAKAYDQLLEIEEPERSQKWIETVQENGWDIRHTPAERAEEVEHSIQSQYFWGIITLLIAIPALITYLRARPSWVEATENGLTTSWGQTVDFSQVTKLDKKKWEHKGLARAHYNDGGKERVFVFDDLKFDRPVIDQLLYDLEQQLKPEQIVGGPPEKGPPGKPKGDASDVFTFLR
ncbi:MAG: hypothetical protein R3C03_17480 [Pirellulaceae bacterium]